MGESYRVEREKEWERGRGLDLEQTGWLRWRKKKEGEQGKRYLE